MEATNLSDIEFKKIHQRMLKNVKTHVETIKMDQSEIKNTTSEIKNTLEGINSRLDEEED